MLEVKNLKKEYRTKKGAVTKALDDVSLNFPETGMVFILGKSGSGKSTLLNICGGLDRMDSGEIIIKGKSSKEFSSQDFDSYRNTYVGFVFQEYNILDEFTVEQNIALALELQNKKPSKEIIDKILEDVDLTDFASRKPNTLSGGQKQRVAIARALVKEPQIIMADEPTGALDSKTGQQVFDTLKKLSKDKLVIVISHDRDFAEQYGDRIIELKDGKIISDQTRMETTDEQNVRFYGTDTVCVTNGSALTDADMQSIKSFLGRSGGTAVISTSREKIAQFKEDRPEISVGTFENIKEQPTPKEYEKQKLIRSHLPLKHAIKMGGGSLKTKPVRLVFTILLSVIAFVLFGLASTLMLFDGHEVTVQSFMKSKINYISFGKIYYVTWIDSDGETSTYDNSTRFTWEEYEKLSAKYADAVPVISYWADIKNLSLANTAQQFYSGNVRGLIPASAKVELLEGRMPKKDDEVAISDFMFDAVRSSGSKFVYGAQKTEVNPNSYEDILYTDAHKITVNVDDIEYKIVGVFKGSDVPADYSKMKSSADSGSQHDEGFSSWAWGEELANGLYMTVAVTDETFMAAGADNIDYHNSYFHRSTEYANINVVSDKITKEDGDNWSYSYRYFNKYEGKKYLDVYGFDGNALSSVGNGAAAVSGYDLINQYKNVISTLNSQIEQNKSDYYNPAYYNYESDHPYPDTNSAEFYDSRQYDAAHAEWESARDMALAGKDEGSEEYTAALDAFLAENPEPSMDDYRYDWEFNHPRYRAAQLQYDADRVAYAVNAWKNSLTEVQRKYFDIAYQPRIDAEAQYRVEHPEPDWYDYDNDNESYNRDYQKWQDALDALLNGIADPNERFVDLSNRYDELSAGEIAAGITAIRQLLDSIGADVSFKIENNISDLEVNIVGFFVKSISDCCYLGADLYDTFYRNDNNRNNDTTKYEEPNGAFIDRVLIPYDGGSALIEELLAVSGVAQEDDSAVEIKNALLEELKMIIDTADTLELAFIITGAILALFAFLLMFNFISASIVAKKKDIGILRAIGARTIDVFKIFVSEALIIALICFAVSALGTFGLCSLLNLLVLDGVGVSIELFVFGPLSVLSILGIALLTAIISTIIPVGLYSRKPPIASIRAL